MQKEKTKKIQVTQSEIILLRRQLGLVTGKVQYEDVQKHINNLLKKL
jgi:hypothetical protein